MTDRLLEQGSNKHMIRTGDNVYNAPCAIIGSWPSAYWSPFASPHVSFLSTIFNEKICSYFDCNAAASF